MPQSLEFISVNIWHIFVTWANLLILVLILKKLLFKPVNNILDKRKNEVGEIYAQAETALKTATAAKTEYEEKLAATNEEAAKIMEQASLNAKQRSAEIVAEAQSQADAALQKAERDIAQERKKAVNEVKNEIAGIALDIAGQVLNKEIDGEVHQELINQFIANVGVSE